MWPMEKVIRAVWQPQALLKSNTETEMRDGPQIHGKAKQHSYSNPPGITLSPGEHSECCKH